MCVSMGMCVCYAYWQCLIVYDGYLCVVIFPVVIMTRERKLVFLSKNHIERDMLLEMSFEMSYEMPFELY